MDVVRFRWRETGDNHWHFVYKAGGVWMVLKYHVNFDPWCRQWLVCRRGGRGHVGLEGGEDLEERQGTVLHKWKHNIVG